MTKKTWGKLRKLNIVESITSKDLVVYVVNGRPGYHHIASRAKLSSKGYSVQVGASIPVILPTREEATEAIISSVDLKTIARYM